MKDQKGKDVDKSSRMGKGRDEKTNANISVESYKSREKKNLNYEDLDKSQSNESGFSGYREGGVYLYDPYDTSNFNRTNQSHITQGRQTTQGTNKMPKSPEGRFIVESVRKNLNIKDTKNDDLNTKTLNLRSKGAREGSDDEKEEIGGTLLGKKGKKKSNNNLPEAIPLKTRNDYNLSNYLFN